VLTMALANMLYAQPPETPNIPSEHGTLGALDLHIPNAEGTLVVLENTTDCDITYYYYVTVVTENTNETGTLSFPVTVAAGATVNVNWSDLVNKVHTIYGTQNFAITHWSFNVQIGTWVMPIYPGEDKTISTSLPPPCDCIRLQFLRNSSPTKVIVSPGTGC
jgi:hypothetical protein